MTTKTLTAAAVAGAVALAGCGASAETGRPAAETASGTQAGTSGCHVVSRSVRGAISSGLQHGAKLGKTRALHVGSVWLVATKLRGPGIDGSGAVARWIVESPRTPGYVFAADAMADEFSDWGRKTPDGFDQFAADGCL